MIFSAQVGAHDSTAWREEVLPFHEFIRRHMMTDTPPGPDSPLSIGVGTTRNHLRCEMRGDVGLRAAG